ELVLGPQIEDERGNRMNQDGDGVNGEDPGDRYVASVELGESGPRVIDAQFRGSNPRMFDSVRLTFSEPIKPSSFTEDDIVEFTGPNGTISTSYTIVPVNGSNDTQFDILFAKQNRQGTYRMTVGPFIEDSLGNYMNQNGDHINGQIPEDRFILEQYLDTSKTKRYDAWKVNRPIRDYRVTRSAITITEAITISDLSVRVNLNHSATGDLRIRLIGPQNQSVVLFDRHGKNGDNLRNTWFSDSADISISQGKPPYNGNYRSIQSLSMFHNSLAAGKWILEVRDTKSGNVGKLLSWSLVVTGTMEDGEGGGMGGMMSAFDNSACVWPVYYLPPSASNGDHSEEWNWADPIEVG
ncbi:proprotein convertase P-domain-containing protein, partial [Thermogemmata fonticola]